MLFLFVFILCCFYGLKKFFFFFLVRSEENVGAKFAADKRTDCSESMFQIVRFMLPSLDLLALSTFMRLAISFVLKTWSDFFFTSWLQMRFRPFTR